MQILRVYARVLGELRPEKGLAAMMTAANVLLAAAQFAGPILFGRIIDALTRAQSHGARVDYSRLSPLVAAWVAFGVFNIAAGVTVALHADRLAHRRRLAVVANYFEHVLSLPLAFHGRVHSGRVMKVMLSGADSMSFLWLSFFREECASLVALCVLLPLTVLLNWWLGGLLLLLVLVFAAFTAFVVGKTREKQGEVTRYHHELAEHAADALGNLPVVQSFTRTEEETRRLAGITNKVLEAQMPVLSWWALATTATRVASVLTVSSILMVGTWLFTHGHATVGAVVSFLSLANMLIARLESTVTFVSTLFVEAPKMQAFFEVLDTTTTIHEAAETEAGVLSGALSFENVRFSYDGKHFAVDDVTFDVEPGETIALVGATGSGKSTTLGLLHRAFDPDSGRITADGRDLRAYSLTSLRRNIAVVFQEPMLFARSIRENLLVGRPGATDAQIWNALERAQAVDVVTRQPHGLDTVVGERGRSLSGGERQRLSIARALLKDPPILILDEATAALDAKTETQLKRALDEAKSGRTTLIIAHRLSTVRDATRILVLEHGCIVESGSFDELVQQNGRFSELARAQFLAPAA